MAKLSTLPLSFAQAKDTGYEVNLAMDGMKSAGPALSDETDYEDVKFKRESAYQGLNADGMEKEHVYQGLGDRTTTDRKTSCPYVNVVS